MTLLIGSIAKDVSRYLKNVKDSYKSLKKSSEKEVRYVIYESNSVDGSYELLKQWADEDASVHVHTERIDSNIFRARNEHNQPCKYEIIAHARNRLMSFMKSYENVETVMLIDMNNENNWPIDGIVRCLDIPKDKYDALICNGIESTGGIIDACSFRDMSTVFGPEVMGDLYDDERYQKDAHKNFLNSVQPIPVFSAFNGLAILNRSLLDKTEYSAFPTVELDMFYRNACDKIVIEVHPCIHEKHIGMFAFENNDIFYYNYKNFNLPIISPHVAFFAKLQASQHNQIMICPFLEWKWYKETLFIM